ncbi:(d)CMP kinase [Emcibacter sp. SYSU 3D8]|uniref:(d)CMP kinase n=1 Tax=Emcibacter sp. SYSU 3D8 TaxID=3133969 RepID=UPI0031FF2330
MIIAIDGPASSGKGTLARLLARHYGLPHLDTGSLYRAVARKLLRDGADLGDEAAAGRAARALSAADLDDPGLRDETTGEAASIVSAMPDVRAALLDYQRTFAHQPGGAVLDGRDVGTVICPEADAKLFVTAAAAVRARRRADELRARGKAADEHRILEDIEARDRRDTRRAVAPLAPAMDAHLLDTSNLSIEAAFEAAKAVVESAVRKAMAERPPEKPAGL